MIKKGIKYTNQEIIDELKASSFKIGKKAYKKSNVIGAVRVMIGGLPVADPDEIITIPEAAENTLEVAVGEEIYELKVGEKSKNDAEVSKAAQKSNEEYGRSLEEKANS